MTNLETHPSSQPILISQSGLELLRRRFEHEVIDPMWFGQSERLITEDDIRQWGPGMDLVRIRFEETIADSFEISNELTYPASNVQ